MNTNDVLFYSGLLLISVGCFYIAIWLGLLWWGASLVLIAIARQIGEDRKKKKESQK